MSQQYNIKWRIEDEKELRSVARNFNNKLEKEIQKNPKNRNILPQFYNETTDQYESRITIEMLHDLISTRQDYNRIINMLKRFMRKGAEEIVDLPGNEYGTRTTKWQRDELTRLAGIVNRKRKERLQDLSNIEMMDSQGLLGYTVGQRFGMGLASRNRLEPTKAFTPGQSQKDIKYKQRALFTESSSKYFENRDMMLKQNYYKTLLENYDQADIQEVLDRIAEMDPYLFLLKFEAAGDKFEKAYPPSRGSVEYQAYVAELKSYWLKDYTAVELSPALASALLNI